jgi:Flp pilus assembly pilin Flp
MATTIDSIFSLLNSTEGAAGVEYALLVAGIALAVLAGMTVFGGSVMGLYTDAVSKLPF